MATVKERTGRTFDDYHALWQWSVTEKETFWDMVWDFCSVTGEKGGRIFDDNNGQMFGARFFPEGRINYAENLLQKTRRQTGKLYFVTKREKRRN